MNAETFDVPSKPDMTDPFLYPSRKNSLMFFKRLLLSWVIAFSSLRIVGFLARKYFTQKLGLLASMSNDIWTFFSPDKGVYITCLFLLTLMGFPFYWIFNRPRILGVLFCVFAAAQMAFSLVSIIFIF